MLKKDGVLRSPRSGVRVDGRHAAERRNFLRTVALQGVSISALCLVGADGSVAAIERATTPAHGPAALAPALSHDGKIVRDFASPYLELTRLLREATEIEHALMLQYLYAAFSLKPDYADIAGTGAPGSTDLIGVAVQEMQHLATVNRLLAALGAAPNLVRQEFPYEPAIYPFEFSLEPLSRKSLAKYIYAEAPSDIFLPAASPKNRAFAGTVMKLLGPGVRVNHLGSLYDAIIGRLEDFAATKPGDKLDAANWLVQLRHIKTEGEEQHFLFFRDVFEGTHAGFGKQKAVCPSRSTLPRSSAMTARYAIRRCSLSAGSAISIIGRCSSCSICISGNRRERSSWTSRGSRCWVPCYRSRDTCRRLAGQCRSTSSTSDRRRVATPITAVTSPWRCCARPNSSLRQSATRCHRTIRSTLPPTCLRRSTRRSALCSSRNGDGMPRRFPAETAK